MHVLPLLVNLVGLRHVLIEDLQGQSDQGWVRHPGAIMPVLYLPQLVCLHLRHAQQQLVSNKACTGTGVWQQHTAQSRVALHCCCFVRRVVQYVRARLCMFIWLGPNCTEQGVTLSGSVRCKMNTEEC